MPNINNNLAQENETSLEITALTHEGRGLAHHRNKPAFITAALPGETVTVKNLRRNKGQYEGFAEQVMEPHPDRISPKCPHFTQCGGCSLQHLPVAAQLKLKQDTFLSQLTHIGKLQPDTLLAPLTGPEWQYRHKARLGVKFVHNKNKVCIGFRERNGRYVNDSQGCEILAESLSKQLPALAALVQQLSCYQQVPQFEVAAGDQHAAVIMRHLQPLTAEDKQHCIDFAEDQQLHFYSQAKGPSSIQRLWPTDSLIANRLHYQLDDFQLTMAFHPTDFTQINPQLNRRMLKQAIDLLAPNQDQRVLDLFCGLGNFTLPFARHAGSVVGVEVAQAMVDRGYENAHRNGIENVAFYQADLSQAWAHHPWAKQHYDTVIFDPPRSGALAIVNEIHHLKPQRIGYISCHSATLARDANILVNEKGYRCTHAGIMDMFPHTQHVEAMAIFERKPVR